MGAISWKSGVSGAWKTAADWSGGVVPGAADDVTISVAGTYSVTINTAIAAHSLTVNDATATVIDQSSLALGSLLAVTAGTFTLGGGSIQGGTINVGSAGEFLVNGGALSGTAFEGAMAITASQTLAVGGGFTLAGMGGSGSGAVTIGANAILDVQGSGTLDHAIITFAGSGGELEEFSAGAGKSSTLTLGGSLTLTQASGSNFLNAAYQNGAAAYNTVVNNGSIAISGGTLSVGYGYFVDNGAVTVSGLGVLDIIGATSLGTHATLSTSGSAAILLDQGGSLSGTITPGTANFDFGGGLLDDVTWEGGFSVGTSQSALVSGGFVVAGAGGTGPGMISIGGGLSNGATLDIQDSETLNNATLSFTGGNGYLEAYLANASAISTLTLGSSLTVTQATGTNFIYGAYEASARAYNSIVDNGTIAVSFGTLVVGYGSFIDNGLISVSGTGVLDINAALTLGANSTLSTSGSGALLLDTSSSVSGTVNASNAHFNFGGGILDDVTWEGPFSVGTSQTALVRGGFAVIGGGGTGPGMISIGGGLSNGATLDIQDSETLNNATLSFTGGNGYLEAYLANATAISTLTLGSSLTVTQATGTNFIYGAYEASARAYNSIVDNGTIAVSFGTLVVGYGSFIDNGLISVSGSGVLDINAALTLGANSTLSTSGSGALLLDTYGSLSGTVNAGAAHFNFGGGFLDDVTWEGPFSVGTSQTALVSGGFAVTGTGGTGPGTISIGGGVSNGATLDIQDSETLNNATLSFTGTNGVLEAYVANAAAISTLTLGSSLTVTQASGSNLLDGAYEPSARADNTIIDNGTIAVSGGTLGVGYGSFVDNGLISVSGSGVLDINAALTFGANATLSTSGSGALLLDTYGSLSGTVNAATTHVSFGGGVLNDVTWEGPFSVGTSQTALVSGGFAVTGANGLGAGTISIGGGPSNAAILYIQDTETLNNATVTFTGTNGELAAYLANSSTPVTLTLGSSLTITQASGSNYVVGGTPDDFIVDNGTIAISGGTLSADAYSFIDNGSIAVSGGVFDIEGALSFGASASLTTSGSGAVLLDPYGSLSGTVNIGTAQVNFGGGLLNDVTWEGRFSVGAGQSALVSGGLTVTGAGGSGPGTISIGGSASNGATLLVQDSETLDNATIDFTGSNGVLEGYANATARTTLTLGANLTLSEAGGSNGLTTDYESTPAENGVIVNNGTIAVAGGTLTTSFGRNVQNSAGLLTNNGLISVNTGTFAVLTGVFTNAGTIAVSGGTVDLVDTSFTNLVSGTLSSGSYSVTNGATLKLSEDTPLTTDAARIIVSGVNSVVESLNSTTNKQVTIDQSLVAVSSGGTLELLAGRGFGGTSGFSDSGMLQLGGGSFASSSVTIGSTGMLLGFGTVTGPLADAGMVEANGGTLVLSGAVSGAGALQVDAGGTLEFGSTVAAGIVASFKGQGGVLRLDASAGFAATVASNLAGEAIDITNTTLTGASASGTVLSLVTSGGTSIGLTLAAPITNERFALTSDGSGGTDVTGYRYAAASTIAPSSLAFGAHHVGDKVSAALTLSNLAVADQYSETLDAGFAGAVSGLTTTGTVANLAAGSTSTLLGVGLNTASAGAIASNATIALATDGAGVDGQGTLSLGTQTVAVSGAVYAYAAGSLFSTAIKLGNVHVGATDRTSLRLTNSGPVTGGYTESLDASIGTATGRATVSGSVSLLGVGATNANQLLLGILSGVAGTYTGGATVSLLSDGSGLDGLGTTALASQLVKVSGAVYAYATPVLSAQVFNFGAARVGDTLAGQVLTITNGTTATAYQEKLDVSLNGSMSTVSAGGSLASTLTLSTAAAGDFTGTKIGVGLVSDGTAIGDGLGTTTLAGQTLTLNGKIYAAAVAQFSETTVDFGVIHVGDSASQAVTLTNGASGALNDSLVGSLQGLSGQGFTAGIDGMLGSGIAAGASDMLGFMLDTSTSGGFSGDAVFALDSHDSDLADLSLGNTAIQLSGIVDNYAVAALSQTSGAGSLTSADGTNYTLALGAVAAGSSALSAGLAVENAAGGLADLLGGSLTVSGSGAFANSGLGGFSGLGAGQESGFGVTLNSINQAGVFSETIVLASAGSNASGYSGALTPETLTVTGTLTGKNLTTGTDSLVGTAGNNVFVAITNTLSTGDKIVGGSGSNTLLLVGGGTFDLANPGTLSTIQSIQAYEGQAASGGLASTVQTVTLRAGLNAAVNVQSGTAAAGNANVETITIVGAANTGAINLGAGVDSVTLGGAFETVNGGAGTALISATAALASAKIVGGSGSATLTVSTVGTIKLNAADTNLTVKLSGASKLTLSGMGFVTGIGSSGIDTITAGAANQTLTGNGGKDMLTGYSGGGDSFLDTSAHLNGVTLGNWTTGDVIDLTDMNSATLKALKFAAGKLTVADGTHTSAFTVKSLSGATLTVSNFVTLGSDGHGGSLIGYHA